MDRLRDISYIYMRNVCSIQISNFMYFQNFICDSLILQISLFQIFNFKLQKQIVRIIFLMQRQPPVFFNLRQNHEIDEDDIYQNQLIQVFLKPGAPKVVRAIAGPGSGKTTTICRLIQKMYLQNQKPLYPNFLVLTFTKRTRLDLVRKITQLIGYQKKKDYVYNRIRNFHSLAFGLIFWRKIIEQDKQQKAFDQISQKITIENKKNYELQRIKKLAWKTYHRFLAEALTEQQQQIQLFKLRQSQSHNNVPVYQLVSRFNDWIQNKFRHQREITFDYSLIKATQFIKNKRNCHKINLDALDLIIVDEFQDSNPAQIKMIDSLMKRSKKDIKLLMIGDYDQNIYRWRGAKLSVIQNFIDQYPNQQMYLNRTYRLSKSVWDIANQLINSQPSYKQFRQKYYSGYKLQPLNQKEDHPVIVKQFDSQYSQVRWVVDKIYQHIKSGVKPGDITILCREFKVVSFYQKLKFQLQRKKIQTNIQVPYDYQGSGSSMSSFQAKYLLSWLKYLYRVEYLKYPRGQKNDIKKILQLNDIGLADDAYINLLDKQRIDQQYVKYSRNMRNQAKRQRSWSAFFDSYRLIKQFFLQDVPIREIIQKIATIIRTSYWFSKQLKQACVTDFIDAIEQIADSIDRQQYNKNPTISIIKRIVELDFQQNVQIDPSEQMQQEQKHQQVRPNEKQNVGFQRKNSDKKNNKEKMSNFNKKELVMIRQLQIKNKRNRMQIQTAHNAKGLQYPIVFICGLSYGYIQSDFSDNPAQYINLNLTDAQRRQFEQETQNDRIQKTSEQLRLIYTAVTRTKGYVYVTGSKHDYLKFIPPFFKPQPHSVFQRLKQICNSPETVKYNQQQDGPSKKYVLQQLQIIKQKNKDRQLRKDLKDKKKKEDEEKKQRQRKQQPQNTVNKEK